MASRTVTDHWTHGNLLAAVLGALSRAGADGDHLDPAEVERLAASDEAAALFRDNIAVGERLGINASPTLLIDGERYTGGYQPRPLSLFQPAVGPLPGPEAEALCSANAQAAGECVGGPRNTEACDTVNGDADCFECINAQRLGEDCPLGDDDCAFCPLTGLPCTEIGALCFFAPPFSFCIPGQCDMTGTCSALPVEMVSFEATSDQEGNVLLAWETASETNNVGFEVQQAQPGADFVRVGFVEGGGTTTTPQRYRYRIEPLFPGTYRFRLKQLDFDGNFAYSEVVEARVEVVGQYALSDAYPNPFNPQTTFTLTVARTQMVRVEVFDVVGRQVAQVHQGMVQANQIYTFTFRAEGLPSGAYFLRVTGETFVSTNKTLVLAK